MKIIYCLNHFLPNQVAGTEVYTWALAKAMQQEKHQVIIVIPNYDTDVNDEYEHDGLRVIKYGEPNKLDRQIIAGNKSPDGIKAFEKLIKNEHPDLIHIQELNHSSGIGMYHLKVLNFLKIPVVVTLHLAGYTCYCGTLMYKDKEPCDGLIRIGKCTRCALSRVRINPLTQQFLYAGSMPLFALNINTARLNNKAGTAFSYPFIIKKVRERLHEYAGHSYRIIVLTDWFKQVLLLNGIPEKKIQLIRQGLPYANEAEQEAVSKRDTPLRIMYMGRIYPAKGLSLLLKATESIDENKFLLDIFGEKNKTKYFETLKQKTALKKNIQWKGTVGQKDVVSTMRSYHAVIIPSEVCEMSPLVIQEAFAAGIPVIGSDVKGIAEQIKDGYNGLLFKMGSVTELKKVIENLLYDKSLLQRLAVNIQQPRSFTKVSEETLKVYESVLKECQLSTVYNEDSVDLRS